MKVVPDTEDDDPVVTTPRKGGEEVDEPVEIVTFPNNGFHDVPVLTEAPDMALLASVLTLIRPASRSSCP